MTLTGHLQGHRLLTLPRVLRQGRQIQVRQQGEVLLNGRIGHLLELRVHRERILRQTDGVPEALAHLLNAIEARQDRQEHPELGALAEMTLQVAAHGHVELLVRPPQLQVGLNRHGVVALQQRIEEFVQGDRGAGAVAVGEVLLGQHLTDGGDPQ